MRSKAIIVVAAVLLGVAAALLAGRYLEGVRRRAAAGTAKVEVVVAKEDIPKGTSAADLAAKTERAEIPREYVAADALTSLRPVDGQVLMTPVGKGEQLTTSRFQVAATAGLSFAVPKGMVAVSMGSDEVHGVAGLVKPGDSVVVVASMKTNANDENSWESRVLVPAAKVLACGSSTGAGSSQGKDGQGGGGVGAQSGGGTKAPSTVTVALSPEDMQRVILAQEVGRVWLALLPPNEQGATESTGMNRGDMFR